MSTYAPETATGRYDWHANGLCHETPELFFPESGTAAGPARRICAACPVRARCLADAMVKESGLSYSFRTGILGGLSPWERAERDRVRTQLPPTAEELAARAAKNRPVAPCGTRAAHARHMRNGEPIDPACAAAWEEHKVSRRKRVADCGTRGGYNRHVRDRTPPCDPCRAANTEANRKYKRRPKTTNSQDGSTS